MQIGIMFDGVEVDSMVIGGPAYNTGMLHKADFVVKVNGEAVNNKFELHTALRRTEMPGAHVVLTVRRGIDSAFIDIPIEWIESSKLPNCHHQLFACFTKLKVYAHVNRLGSCVPRLKIFFRGQQDAFCNLKWRKLWMRFLHFGQNLQI